MIGKPSKTTEPSQSFASQSTIPSTEPARPTRPFRQKSAPIFGHSSMPPSQSLSLSSQSGVALPFDGDVQDDIVAMMSQQPEFLDAATHWLKPSYFKGAHRKEVVEELFDFYEKYESPPTAGQMRTSLGMRGKLQGAEGATLLKYANGCFSHVAKVQEYTLDVVTRFAQTQAHKEAVLDILPMIDEGKWEEISKRIDQAQEVGNYAEAKVHWLFEQAVQRAFKRTDEEYRHQYVIPTGIYKLDRLFRWGGPCRGEVGCLVAPTNGGKCLRGDTLVSIPQGLKRLDTLVPSIKGWHVLSTPFEVLDGDGKVREVSRVYCDGEGETQQLTLRNGIEIEGTKEHPLRVMQNGEWVWKRIEEIVEGDEVATSEALALPEADYVKLPLFDQSSLHHSAKKLSRFPDVLTEDLAEWLGWLIAEGYTGSPLSMPTLFTFTNKDLSVIERFSSLTKDLFGMSLRRCEQNDSISLQGNSRALYHFLEACLDLPASVSREKIVPEALLISPPSVIRAFLSAFFEAEGHVENRTRIELSSASAQIVRTLQILFQRLNVPAKVASKEAKASNGTGGLRTYWRLTIEGVNDLRRFQEVAGFLKGGKKYEKLEARLNVSYAKKSDAYAGACVWVRKIFEEYKEKERAKPRAEREGGIVGRLGSRKKAFEVALKRGRISRVLCEELLNAFLDASEEYQAGLRALLRYRPVKVLKKERKRSFTYDIEVPVAHSFIANGIISHNSIGLSHMAKRAIYNNNNVFIASFEMAEDKYADRMDASLTGLSMGQLMRDREGFLKAMEPLQKRFGRSVAIQRYSTGSATLKDVEKTLRVLKRRDGWVPDLIVLDYAAIVKPSIARDKRYEEVQQVIQEFRALCIKYNAVGWTAMQTTKSGEVAYWVRGEHVATSWDSLSDCDHVISINVTDEEKRKGWVRLYAIKIRDGIPKVKIPALKSDWGKMQFVDIGWQGEEKPPEKPKRGARQK